MKNAESGGGEDCGERWRSGLESASPSRVRRRSFARVSSMKQVAKYRRDCYNSEQFDLNVIKFLNEETESN